MVAAVALLAGCSGDLKLSWYMPGFDNEQVGDVAGIGGTIRNDKAAGRYDDAYQTVRSLTKNNKFKDLLDSPDLLVFSLQLAAYKNDHEVFYKLLEYTQNNNSDNIIAFRKVSNRFDVLHDYYICYFSSVPASAGPCGKEASKLSSLAPEYREKWYQFPI